MARSGISFSKAEKEKIKSLVESNKLIEAQLIILKAVEGQVGGLATRDVRSLSQQWGFVKEEIGNSFKVIGKFITETERLPKLLFSVAQALQYINILLDKSLSLYNKTFGARNRIYDIVAMSGRWSVLLAQGEGEKAMEELRVAFGDIFGAPITDISDTLPDKKPFDDITDSINEMNKVLSRVGVDKLQDEFQKFVNVGKKVKDAVIGVIPNLGFNTPTVSPTSLNAPLPTQGIGNGFSFNQDNTKILELLQTISLNTANANIGGTFR